MRWTRQRRHVACSTLVIAAFKPSCASEITSLTPRKPCRASLRKNSVQKVSVFRRTDIEAQHFASSVAVDADRNDDGNRDDAAGLARLHVDGVEPDIGPGAFQRAVEEGLHLVVDLATRSADLALGHAAHAHRLDELVDRAGRHALDVGLLDDSGQRLRGHALRLQKAGEVAAFVQLGDPQLDRTGARFPHPVAVAVALIDPVGITGAMGGAGVEGLATKHYRRSAMTTAVDSSLPPP